jgi:plastocyanin
MHSYLTKLLFASLLLVVVAAAACGDTADDAPSTSDTEATQTEASSDAGNSGESSDAGEPAEEIGVEEAVQIEVDREGSGDIFATEIANFQLQSLTVEVGSTVVWTNEDQAPHTVTSGTPGAQSGLFDTDNLGATDSFSFTFEQEGEFPYFCRIHPNMTATITVAASSSSADTDAMDADDSMTMETSGEAMTDDAMAMEEADGEAMTDSDDAMAMKEADGDAMTGTDDAMAMEDPDGDAMAMEEGGHVHQSAIVNFKLETVTIDVGTAIEWKNDDGAGHTSTFGSFGSNNAGDIWDSGNLIADVTFSHTFDEAGEFPYFCRIHPSMTGTITVVDAS